MATTIVPDFVRRDVAEVTDCVRARVQHEYDEFSLYIETKLWQTKNAMKDTVPVKIYRNYDKVFTSYKTMRARGTAERCAKEIARASNPDLVMIEEHSSHNQQVRAVCNTEFERERRWNFAEEKGIAWQYGAPDRAACHARKACLNTQCNTPQRTACVPDNIPEPQCETDYMEEVRALHPASDDHKERRKRTTATLESILGPERMASGVGLPSGHSGISDDPVLTNYYKEKYINHTLDLWQGYQDYQRRQWEKQQRKVAEQEAERQRKIVILEHYCSKYDQRILKLVQFGPKINTEITKLLRAFENGDLESLQQATITLINEVLEPVNSIFEDMKEEIALEELGAQEIKNAWPLDGIDMVLSVFKKETLSAFAGEFQVALSYMLQGFRALYKPILSAVPLTNPLNEQPAPVIVAAPIPVTFYDYAASVSSQLPPQLLPQIIQQQFQVSRQHSQALVQQPKAPQAVTPKGINAGRNFASFADLTNATKICSSEQAYVPNISTSLVSNSSPSTGLPTATAPADNASSTPNNNKALVLMKYIEEQVLDFQDNVSNFVKEGKVNITRRNNNETILQWMVDYVADDSGVLTGDDGYLMKTEIQKMISKIANLSSTKEKNVLKTRNINVLAHQALQVWA